jgi:glycosyltransferase involved in cell wall biosynthesis
MNILLLVPGGVDKSGRERVIPALLWLIERLAQKHQVTIVALRQYEEPCRYPLLGAQVINLGLKPGAAKAGQFLYRLRQVRQAAVQSHAQLIHAFWAADCGLLAGLIGRWLRIPVVVSIGGGELVWLPQVRYGMQGRWPDRMRVSLALRLAGAVTGGSRFVLAGLNPAHAHWIPLGVPPRRFRPLNSARSDVPPWRLLHVATLNPVKDQTTLLHAMGQLVAEVPQIHLDVVGEDTLHGRVQTLASTLGLDEAITFHGFLPQDQLVPLYERAHLFVQSSLHESQGVAACEAAAAGVPAVGTAVGLVSDLAPLAATAVPVGDAAALASAVCNLLHDPARRQVMGRAAHDWATTHNACWTAAQFEHIYEQLYE